MKRINVSDMTLQRQSTLSFKEKIEIARQLDNLKADVIHMPRIENIKTDSLLIRTACAFIKSSTVAVSVGTDEQSLNTAWNAVSNAKHSRLSVNLPVSAVQMEYFLHKKPDKMLDLAASLFTMAAAKCNDVEFHLYCH